jgi:hypothetical protein
VADDGAAIGCSSDIKFKAVAAVSERQLKGLDGVFRDRSGRAGATVAKEKRAGHLHRL